MNELKSIGDFGWSVGEWRSGSSATVRVSSVGLFASGIPRVNDLQRHERSPITTSTNIAYRSVFEKGFLECGLSALEPEATTPEDGAAPLVGGGIADEFVCDDAEGFMEAAARLMAARPLARSAGA